MLSVTRSASKSFSHRSFPVRLPPYPETYIVTWGAQYTCSEEAGLPAAASIPFAPWRHMGHDFGPAPLTTCREHLVLLLLFIHQVSMIHQPRPNHFMQAHTLPTPTTCEVETQAAEEAPNREDCFDYAGE